MKNIYLISLILLVACNSSPVDKKYNEENPFLTGLNQPIDYAAVTAEHIEEYGNLVIENSAKAIARIQNEDNINFENIFVALDDLTNDLDKANNNSFVLYWVSPDSMTRTKGYAIYEKLDSVGTTINTDKKVYEKVVAFLQSDEYSALKGHRRRLVDEIKENFEHSGVNLPEEKLNRYKELVAEINKLTSAYSNNMNTSDAKLTIDSEAAEGIPQKFLDRYKTENGGYAIPAMPATQGPVMNNASKEQTRKAYLFLYRNRAADKNLEILDQLRDKRYEIGQIMGKSSYAEYNLETKMAKNPENVWNFINDLRERSSDKAAADLQTLAKAGNTDLVNPWDVGYIRNQILKTTYNVDHEKIREYLPMDACLKGMMDIYQELLGLRYEKVENPSVWHEEVEMYNVYEGEELKGRFYLDLYPRPNKESWFYGVSLTNGKQTPEGYEVPVKMLLGNFTRPTEDMPSLVSHSELRTLFHEFGHIMDGISYDGEFVSQYYGKSDFVEAMSQIFENWIWDYDILSTFAHHYKTGEVLPKETFDNMVAAQNITSGLGAQGSLRYCVYDMTLYDKHDPDNPFDTDEIWKMIDEKFGRQNYIEGTHPQASWIHINTHPVYMYGYLWSRVYAQDMFTEFEKNGLRDTETGIRYRKLILANGSRRDIDEAVEEFLGRPTNNEAYIESLGL